MQRKKKEKERVSGYCCVLSLLCLFCLLFPFLDSFIMLESNKRQKFIIQILICVAFCSKKNLFAFMFSEFFSTQKKTFFFLLFFVYLKSANLYAASAFFILCRANNCACSLMSCKKLRKPSIKFFLLLLFFVDGPTKKIFFFFDSCRDTKGKTQSICR